VATSVVGGSETSMLSSSKISNAAFQHALESTIDRVDLFRNVVAPDEADYELKVVITHQDQPTIGFDPTVKLLAEWKLTRRGDAQAVWSDHVFTEHKASTSESLSGAKRIRLGNEGAARKNIAEGLQAISRLTLTPGAPTPVPTPDPIPVPGPDPDPAPEVKKPNPLDKYTSDNPG